MSLPRAAGSRAMASSTNEMHHFESIVQVNMPWSAIEGQSMLIVCLRLLVWMRLVLCSSPSGEGKCVLRLPMRHCRCQEILHVAFTCYVPKYLGC